MDAYAKSHPASKFATNWIVHVLILIILIIGFVLYDKISSRKPRVASTSQSVPAANNSTMESRANHEPPPLSEASANEASRQKESSPTDTTTSAATASPTTATAAPTPPTPDETAAPPTTAGSRGSGGIQVSFYRITRQGLTDLQKISQTINVAGESSGGIVGATRIQQLITGGELQYLSGNRYKDFDEKHPTLVFKGQRHSEASRNMGLFFQVTALRKNENSQLIEVKGWGALKASDPDENYFTGEMTLAPRFAAYITGFLPKKGTYSDDEKQLFESDRVLKTLNQEDFNDGSTDLIMVIEFAKSN